MPTEVLQDVIGQPLGAMVETDEIDPGTHKPVKVWRGLADVYSVGRGDPGFRVGTKHYPQGTDGPVFVKEVCTHPVTGEQTVAWRHMAGGIGNTTRAPKPSVRM